jgi:hypothetical protein
LGADNFFNRILLLELSKSGVFLLLVGRLGGVFRELFGGELVSIIVFEDGTVGTDVPFLPQ